MAIRVIYLAAGTSSRMGNLTKDTHKCLLEIGGRTIIEHFMDTLIDIGAPVDTFHIVTGYHGNKFKTKIGPFYPKRHARGRFYVRYHRNPLYRVTGAAQSLYTCLNTLRREPCLVMEGDHYLHPKLIEKLVFSEYENTTLVDENTVGVMYDEETLAYGLEGLLEKLVWPPGAYAYKSMNLIGEAVTMFKLSKKGASTLATILEEYLLESGPARREIIEPMNRLMKMVPIHYLSADKPWTEIDFPKDLQKARMMFFE